MSAHENHRILVVDDNRAIHDDFRKILHPADSAMDQAEADFFGEPRPAAEQPSFEIDSAFQGEEGVDALRRSMSEGRPYAMAFVDVRMPPGMDGIATAAQLWEICPELQIVICTAHSDYSWHEMVRRLGHCDRLLVLKKPFAGIEALQLACALTEKWKLTLEAKLRIETLEAVAGSRAAELRKSEERFRLIAENAADLIAVLDLNGRPIYRSPSFQGVLGFSSAELRDAPLERQFHPDDCAKVIAAKQRMIRTGLGQVMEFRMAHRDGSWRVLESHGTPVCNAQGEVEHLVIVGRDITERKREEEERRQMEVQLRHAMKMESIGRLAAGIAHEINTPAQYIGDNTHFVQAGFRDLMGVLEANDRLLDAAKSGAITPELIHETEAAAAAADAKYLIAEIPKAIEQSIQGLSRVSKIVGAMKEFSHPGFNDKTAIDLNRAVESTITVATNEWKYVANMVTHYDPGLPPVRCLPCELNQVVLNIIVNASHAIADVVGDGSRGKGTITVSTLQDGDWAEIRIADTGTGIPEENQRKIFDPFFTTKGVGKGTGQGLAIAHSVVIDKHGGQIRVESTVGKGSTFIIRLPLRASAMERNAA